MFCAQLTEKHSQAKCLCAPKGDWLSSNLKAKGFSKQSQFSQSAMWIDIPELKRCERKIKKRGN